MARSVERVAVIGLGLIGSSIARAVKERLPQVVVTGHDANDAVREIAPAMLRLSVEVPDPAEYVALGAARQAARLVLR